MITERRTKASDTPFLVARNTFRVFVKAGDVFDVGVGDIIVSSDAFCQNLAANTETNKRKLHWTMDDRTMVDQLTGNYQS